MSIIKNNFCPPINANRLEITTVSSCIMNCNFCPQEVFRKAYNGKEKLSFSDFKNILENVPKIVDIIFSGFSEPFLNPDCVNMIEYASSHGFNITIFSTLVGLKLEDLNRLRKCNIKTFILHLPDNNGNAKIPVTENYKNVLATTFQTMHIDGFSIMNDNFVSNERAGLCINVPKRHVYGWFYCEKLVTPQFVMLPNCDVVLCCNDFGLKNILGNLLTESYEKIAKSSKYKKICNNRFSMSGDYICRHCKLAYPEWKHLVKELGIYTYKHLE